jgi:hypothetical protein
MTPSSRQLRGTQKTARGTCECCGVAVIGSRADVRMWARCVCVGCLPPPPRLPIASIKQRGDV